MRGALIPCAAGGPPQPPGPAGSPALTRGLREVSPSAGEPAAAPPCTPAVIYLSPNQGGAPRLPVHNLDPPAAPSPPHPPFYTPGQPPAPEITKGPGGRTAARAGAAPRSRLGIYFFSFLNARRSRAERALQGTAGRAAGGQRAAGAGAAAWAGGGVGLGGLTPASPALQPPSPPRRRKASGFWRERLGASPDFYGNQGGGVQPLSGPGPRPPPPAPQPPALPALRVCQVFG